MDNKEKASNEYTMFGKILTIFSFIAVIFATIISKNLFIGIAVFINGIVLAIIFFGVGKNRRMIKTLYEKLNIETEDDEFYNTQNHEDDN